MTKLSLCDADFDKNYIIIRVCVDDCALKNQLKSLGFCEGEKIRKLTSNYGKSSYLVKVVGINYAIDKKVAEKIMVCYE